MFPRPHTCHAVCTHLLHSSYHVYITSMYLTVLTILGVFSYILCFHTYSMLCMQCITNTSVYAHTSCHVYCIICTSYHKDLTQHTCFMVDMLHHTPHHIHIRPHYIKAMYRVHLIPYTVHKYIVA